MALQWKRGGATAGSGESEKLPLKLIIKYLLDQSIFFQVISSVDRFFPE